jgi:hypothetical protein
MRCRTARTWIVADRDGELAARRGRALERHLVRCGACRAEQVAIEDVLGLLDGLSQEAEVPARLEQRVLRQVRLLADEETTRSRWWPSMTMRALAPALAGAAVVLLTVVGLHRDERAVSVPDAAPERRIAARPEPAPNPVAVAKQPRRRVPDQPPAELASRPDLFVDLPLLAELEKIEHFDSIAGMDADPTAPEGGREPSNG